jgi:hypothetical protein
VIALSAAVGLVLLVVVAVVLYERRLPGRARRVLVNLRDQPEAIRGLLVRQRGPWLVLAQAELLQTDGAPTPIDGEVLIERPQIVFVQLLQ